MAGERSDLGKIFITDGGIYDANTTYEKLTMVSYNNSTYITLRTVTGVTPSNDRINYGLMAQGFTATYLSSVTAEDVQGLVVEAGSETPAQSLINAIADRVANQLVSNSDLQDILSDYILKSAIANNLSITEEGKVLDARQGKALNDAKVSIDGRWFGFTNSNAPSGYRAISTHIKHTSLCPLLYCDEAGTVFILYNFAASTPPSTISVLTPYYIHDAGNIQQVVWVADTSYGGTVRIKVVYKQYLVRGGWMSLNGRAQFLMQTYADS